MTPAPDFSPAMLAIILAGGAQFGGLLIWGAILGNRVKQLEREHKDLQGIATTVARLEGRVDNLVDQLKELNGNFRWMRDHPVHSSAA